MSKIFPDHKVRFSLILPQILNGYKDYPILELAEPDYEKYIGKYFKITPKASSGFSLRKFDAMAKRYDYIGDIISSSLKFYRLPSVQPKRVGIFCRYYDIRNMLNDRFGYYDITKAKFGEINIDGDKIYRNGEIMKHIKKTYKEVKIIRKMLKNGRINLDQ
ncbi:hypothetical protein KDE12_05315 [Campylobacter sp. faydin G-105]|uniref:hypothetical protein n=1 Tax=Campylobacter anatolicus TaxID=2829105 RepID=UPI001B9838DC|nr:hypothetical protein [Campylobacter anatolicus]MBR8462275.1 hypothetical protein [Campylobacter anatolicus]